jgi:LCP family protein required for cell wall assembly
VTQLASSARHGNTGPDEGYRPYRGHGFMPAPEPDGPARGRHATPLGQGFGHVISWTLLGSIIPGAGLIAAGRRLAGGLALGVTALVGLIAFIGYLTVDRVRFAASFLADPNKILIAAGILLLLVLGWIAVVIATHSATRRYSNLSTPQRVLASMLVTALIGAVAVPTAVGAQDAWLANDAIRNVFQTGSGLLSKSSKAPDTTKPDPWANVPRVNVLLMGGDSGADRIAVRPDTMIVASIDTKTGNTVLISLPRNLEHVPFPPGSKGADTFPNGFYCTNASGVNTECLLNALWTWGDDHASYYPGDKHPGLTATVEGIEQVTGLNIDQYVLLNLRGFEDFIDAIGGLTINAKSRVPIGGHGNPGDPGGYSPPTGWIKPGVQHMNGYRALWYARARQYSSDFDRMNRQRCVIGALVQQANPAAIALGFANIMRTLKKNFMTSIPLQDVDAWVKLALRVKKAKVTSLAFTDQVIKTYHPDFDKMRRLVQQAINPPKPTTTPTPSTGPTTTKKKTTTKKTPTPSETGQATDLTAVC